MSKYRVVYSTIPEQIDIYELENLTEEQIALLKACHNKFDNMDEGPFEKLRNLLTEDKLIYSSNPDSKINKDIGNLIITGYYLW